MPRSSFPRHAYASLLLTAALAGLATPIVAAPSSTTAAEAVARPMPASDAAWAALPANPRLFARAERWQALREQIRTDDVSRRLFELLRDGADEFVTAKPIEYKKEGRRLLEPIRQGLNRITTLALVARLGDDPRHLESALREMRALASLPDWNPIHYLDVAEATLALASGYDWLHDRLPAEDRELFARVIISHGLQPSFVDKHEYKFWINGTNNWNQVCHGGLVAGALAIADRDPALARTVVERAVNGLVHSSHSYAPDGAYVEGPGYWAYGIFYHVALVAALESALGDRCGLDTFPGFLESATYINQMGTPAGGSYNYGDNGSGRGFSAPLFWFARRLDRPDLIAHELATLPQPTFRRVSPFALLWWNPAFAASTTPAPEPARAWMARGDNPVAVFRTRWQDPAATFVGFKGGMANLPHGQMDAGSFIVEADGVRWAVELGTQNYNSLESRGFSIWNQKQNSQRWTVFRLGADGQNIARFNGAPPVWDGFAEFVASDLKSDSPFAVCDLGRVYADQVASARRGARLLADGRVLLQDEWSATAERPANLSWQWLTRANVAVDATGATLSEKNQTLRLEVLAPAKFEIVAQDFSKPVSEWDVPNPGLTRLQITVPVAAGGSGTLSVLATPGSVPAAPAPVVTPLLEWTGAPAR